jgi:hypothetical protein
MPAAIRAHHLGADHPVGGVRLLVDRVLAGGRVERRPPAARVVLRLGTEELRPTARAAVCARLERMVVFTGERRLGALPPQDAVLLRIQLGAPLFLGLLDFRHHFSLIRVPPYSLATGAGITRVRDGGSLQAGRSLPLKEEPT